MESFQEAMHKVFLRQLFSVAGEAFLVYNYFITLRMEVDHIWSAKWTVAKALFLFNRYMNLVGQTVFTLQQLDVWHASSFKFCSHFLWFMGIFGFISGESIRILVLLRAWAVWGCKRPVAVTLIGIYLFYFLANFGVVLYAITRIRLSQQAFVYLEETGICIARGGPAGWIAAVIGFSLDVFAFAMVAYPLSKLYMTTQLRYSPFVRVLSMDALLYFFVTVSSGTLGIITQTVFSNTPLADTAMGFGLPVTTVFGQRVVLNLRQLRSKSQCLLPNIDPTGHPAYEMSRTGGVMVVRTVDVTVEEY
ncbi:hypothetical protein JVU11DRAFT_6692 [Chiua virens]|nr:hypothetical protein JVU11DRAFT_6692 [Chiua virens]